MSGRWIAIFLLPFLAGCLVIGPGYAPPDLDAPVPERFQQAPEASTGSSEPESPALDSWWSSLGDPELDRLLARTLERNHDLAAASARVEQLRARFRSARLARLPSLSVEGSAVRGALAESSTPSGSDRIYESYGLTLTTAWELDLWGRLARADQAARADLLQLQESREALAHSLAAQVATGYMALLAQRERLEVARRRVASLEGSRDLVDRRYRRGLTSALDVRQARRALALAESTLPGLRVEILHIQQDLAVLAGDYPSAASPDQLECRPLPRPDPVPPGLPSELLLRRPDLRAAEAELRGLTARVGQARAARFPTIRLTGQFGYGSSELANLLDPAGELWSLAAGIVQPILNGGRLAAEERVARARLAEGESVYARTVLTAFAEVEGALATRREKADTLTSLQEALEEAGQVLRTAEDRYRRGLIGYLNVLEAQQALSQIEDSLVLTELALVASHIDLYRALGGGWSRVAGGSPGESS